MSSVSSSSSCSCAAAAGGYSLCQMHSDTDDVVETDQPPGTVAPTLDTDQVDAPSPPSDELLRLEQQLRQAQQAVHVRDEEVTRLNNIRDNIEAEMHELTASVFQEAHKMVLAANEKQAAAEKGSQEAGMKIDMLQAEVAALKTLVLTSTPSRPNTRRHPHIEVPRTNGMNLFKRGHRRTPSNQELTTSGGAASGGGSEASPPHSPTLSSSLESRLSDDVAPVLSHKLLTDPSLMQLVRQWRAAPNLSRDKDTLVGMLHRGDVAPCLDFAAVASHWSPCAASVAERVVGAVYDATVAIEELRTPQPAPETVTNTNTTCANSHRSGDEEERVVRAETIGQTEDECALLGGGLVCTHRLRVSDECDWINISQICRNRVTAACEFVNYLRYIQQGLVKASDGDVYQRIMLLRRAMALARLGFSPD